MLRSFVSFLNRLSLGRVFSFGCSAVERRAFLVIHVCLGVNPNLSMASARRWRFHGCVTVRCFRCGWACSSGTGCCRRSLGFEQTAEIKFAR
jgi:hypothetical protein